jgi:hypothetical protein
VAQNLQRGWCGLFNKTGHEFKHLTKLMNRNAVEAEADKVLRVYRDHKHLRKERSKWDGSEAMISTPFTSDSLQPSIA